MRSVSFPWRHLYSLSAPPLSLQKNRWQICTQWLKTISRVNFPQKGQGPEGDSWWHEYQAVHFLPCILQSSTPEIITFYMHGNHTEGLLKQLWAGAMAQDVACLPSKCEALSLNPSTAKTKQNTLVAGLSPDYWSNRIGWSQRLGISNTNKHIVSTQWTLALTNVQSYKLNIVSIMLLSIVLNFLFKCSRRKEFYLKVNCCPFFCQVMSCFVPS
jgi:hypothetical protein